MHHQQQTTNEPHPSEKKVTSQRMASLSEAVATAPVPSPAKLSTPETAREDFLRQGYAVIPGVLDAETIAQLREAIDRNDKKKKGKNSSNNNSKKHVMYKRVFEHHPALCLRVFKNETVLPIVQRLLGQCGSARPGQDSCLTAHLIHNNAFRIDPGGRGQATGWHTDDAPTFQTADGGSLPPSVVCAPLALTCMYFLNDLRSPRDGGTRVVEGSHRFGRPCTDEAASKHPELYAACPAGSVLIISSHTWHRGSPVGEGGSSRYLFQATYGRRLVGHKHGSVMDYQLPTKVERLLRTEEDRKLMGYLQGGAYS
mmetsp:Transcript_15814/g.23479  ORF Transcript_15814/g.23479 Transcript_15814/m.23479 type:complete len:312 (-) Transcript_15814:1121-2056(-)